MKLKEYSLDGWLNFKIKRKKKINNITVLLLSLKGLSPREGRKNLLAIDEGSNIQWIAELPTSIYDSYYDMKYENGIIYAKSSNSFISEITPETGVIVKSYMVK